MMSTCPSRAVEGAGWSAAEGGGASFLPQAAIARAIPDSRSTRETQALVDRIKELPLKTVLEGLFSGRKARQCTPAASTFHFHEGSLRRERGRAFPQLLRLRH